MADTITANLGLQLPQIYPGDQWGNKLNSNFAAIDVFAGSTEFTGARSFGTAPLVLADVALTYTPGTALSVVAGQYILTESEGFAYKVAASAATDHNVSTAGGVKLYVQASANGYDIRAFGAVGNGVADDTAALQRALDCAKALGGVVSGSPASTYRVQQAGTYSTPSRGYCIQIGANTTLQDVRITYTRTSATTDILISDNVGDLSALVTADVALRRVTIDGDSDSAGAGNGFNIRMMKVKNLVIDQVRTIDPTNWGTRIEQCDGVFVSGASSDHGPDVNADGFHYIDCRNVSHIGGNIYTQGDDGFIIEAANFDIWNYNVSGITVEAPTAGIAAGRGILILRDTSVGTTVRRIENISISATARNCYGQGFVISAGAAVVSGCSFDIVADNCGGGALLSAGDAAAAGTIRSNRFKLLASDSTTYGFFSATLSGGVLEDNAADMIVSNPADAAVGITLRGARWTGSFVCDYDPLGTKVSKTNGIDILTTESAFFAQCEDASNNIYLRDGCSENAITLGHIRGGTSDDVEVLGSAVSTVFVGGYVAGSVTGATAATRFIGTVNLNTSIQRAEFGLGGQLPDKSSDATGLVTEFFRANAGTRPDAAVNWLTGTISRVLNGISGQFAVGEGSAASRARFGFRHRESGGTWGAWSEAQPILSGTTANRPTTGLIAGLGYFDTTLTKPIWRNGSNSAWVDATGATV